MKAAFSLLLFFLCINIAVSVINALDLIPFETSPYADPATISTDFLTIPSSLAMIGISVIGGILTQNPYVTVVGLVVFSVDKLLPFGSWAITGFPTFLGTLGVPPIFVTGLQLLFFFVWFMAIMEFLSGRDVL